MFTSNFLDKWMETAPGKGEDWKQNIFFSLAYSKVVLWGFPSPGCFISSNHPTFHLTPYPAPSLFLFLFLTDLIFHFSPHHHHLFHLEIFLSCHSCSVLISVRCYYVVVLWKAYILGVFSCFFHSVVVIFGFSTGKNNFSLAHFHHYWVNGEWMMFWPPVYILLCDVSGNNPATFSSERVWFNVALHHEISLCFVLFLPFCVCVCVSLSSAKPYHPLVNVACKWHCRSANLSHELVCI